MVQRQAGADAPATRDRPLFVAVDGFGKQGLGQRAAEIVIQALAGAVSPEAVIRSLEAAHLEIAAQARQQAQGAKMGAAVAIALRSGTAIELFHVGDVRAYLATPSAVSRLTEDHTLASQLVRLKQLAPEDAPAHPAGKTLVRYVGKEGDLKVERQTVELDKGETLVLCTGGIHRALPDDAFVELAKASDAQLEACVEGLIRRVASGGADENLRLLAIRPSAPASAPPPGVSGGLRGLVENLLATPSPEADLDRLLSDLLDLAVDGTSARAGLLVASEGGERWILAQRGESAPELMAALRQGAERAMSGSPSDPPGIRTWSLRPGPGDRAVALALAGPSDRGAIDLGPILELGAWSFALRAIVALRRGSAIAQVS